MMQFLRFVSRSAERSATTNNLSSSSRIVRRYRGLATQASSPADLAARSVELAQAGGRAALATRRAEVSALHAQVSKLGPDAIAGMSFPDLCSIIRVLSSSNFLPEDKLMDAAGKKLEAHLTGGDESVDAAAYLALAACEAGQNQPGSLAVRAVDAISASGLIASSASRGPSSSASKQRLGGGGAAALALAAAAAGKAEPQLLEALLKVCSANEIDLTASALGDLHLASLLVNPGTLEAIDTHALSFLQTMCNEVLVDDPRGFPPPSNEYMDSLTPFEQEVSKALTASEVPHCRGALLAGVFFPLSSHAMKAVFCPEDLAASAIYENGSPGNRSALQIWKYRAVVASGWRVFAISEADWRAQAGSGAKASHVRTLLQGPPLDMSQLSGGAGA